MGDRLGVVVMAYGTPASPDDVEAYYTHIRRGHPPHRGAAGRPRAPLRRHRRHLAAGRAHRGAARRARRRPRGAGARPVPRRAGPEARAAVHRGRGGDARRRRRRRHRRPRAGPALLPGVGRAVPGPAGGRRVDASAAASRTIDSWHLEPTYLAFLARAVRDALASLPRAHQGAVHRPLAARARARGRPLPRPAARVGRRRRRGRRARPLGGLVDRVAVGRPHGRAVARPRHPRRDPRAGRHRPSRRRAGVPAGLRQRPPRGGLRPRHRGGGASPTRSGSPSPARACSTTTPPCSARWPTASSPPRHDLDRRGRRRHHRPGRRARGRDRGSRRDDRRAGSARRQGAVEPVRRRRARRGRRRVPRPGARGRRRCAGELGIDGDLVSPSARRAHVWSRGALRLLPEAQVLGVPTDLDELAGSGILSADGLARVAAGTAAVGSRPTTSPSARSMRTQLGDEAAERLVDPLVGGINAGDTDRLSLAATVPQLDAAARSGAPTLVDACRAQRAAVADPTAPVFFAPRAGMGALVDALVADLERRGVDGGAGTAVGDRAQRRVVARHRRPRDDERRCAGLRAHAAAPPTAWWSPLRLRSAAALVRDAAPRAATPARRDPLRVGGAGQPRGAARRDRPRARRQRVPRPARRGPHRHRLLVDVVEVAAPRAATGRCGCARRSAATATTPRSRSTTTRSIAAVLADLRDTMALRGDPTEVRVSRWIELVPAVPPRPPRPRRRHRGRPRHGHRPASRWPAPRCAASASPRASARAPPPPARSSRPWHDRPSGDGGAHHERPRPRRRALPRRLRPRPPRRRPRG